MSLRKNVRRALVHMGASLLMHGALFALLLVPPPKDLQRNV
jgi:hypothetical protein